MLFDLGVKDLTHVLVYCDNDSAVKLVLNPAFHKKQSILMLTHTLLKKIFRRKLFVWLKLI